jgi:hypothetical protein
MTVYSCGVLIVVGFLPAILWRLRGHPLAYYFDESFSPSQLIDVLIIPFGLFLLFHLARQPYSSLPRGFALLEPRKVKQAVEVLFSLRSRFNLHPIFRSGSMNMPKWNTFRSLI